jgi:hypothetical protein
VRQRGHPPARQNIFQGRRVTEVWLEEFGADFIANFRDVGVRLQFGNFKHQLASERITVGMQTGGG